MRNAGFSVLAGADSDPLAVETHTANIGGLGYVGDLTDPSEFLEHLQAWGVRRVDLVAGGPPCQPFSRAGTARLCSLVANGERVGDDPQAGLWRSFVEVVASLRPRAVLVENVPDLPAWDDGTILIGFYESLGAVGYEVDARVLDAYRHGVPQHRARLFIVGLRGGRRMQWPAPRGRAPSLRDAIGDLPPVPPAHREECSLYLGSPASPSDSGGAPRTSSRSPGFWSRSWEGGCPTRSSACGRCRASGTTSRRPCCASPSGRRGVLLDTNTARIIGRVTERDDPGRWQIRLDLHRIAGAGGPDAPFNYALLDLGAKLAERFHRPKLTKDVARLLALLVFDRDADAYAGRGLRYVDPKLQEIEVKELKSGKRKEKVSYAERQRCAAYLVERLDRARSAEEILGVVLQTLIAAHFADERVTAKSHRIGFSLPGSHGYYYDGIGPALASRREIPGLVEKIARPALPRRMRDQLAGREAERRDAERQEEVVGRDAEGLEVTRGEVVADGEALTADAKRAFEETAGPIEWSAPSQQERQAA